MEQLPKYCDIRYSKKEGRFYRHMPSSQMRDLLGITNKNFKNFGELKKYAAETLIELQDAIRRNSKLEIDPLSVRGLVQHYYESSYYLKLKKNSKKDYKFLLDFGLDYIARGSNKPFGDYAFKNIDRAYIDRFNVSIEQEFGTHRLFHTNKVLRRVFNVGIKHEKLTHNPFTLQELSPPPRRKQIWTKEQLDQFVKVADENDLSSIGTIALFCFYLSQRPGDMRQLRNKDLKDGILSFTQEKSITCRKGTPVHLTFDLNLPTLKPLLDRLQFVRENEEKLIDRVGDQHKPYPTHSYNFNRDEGYFTFSYGNHGYRRIFIHSNKPDAALIQYETTGSGLSYTNCRVATAKIRNLAKLPKELQMRDFRATGATNLGLAGCSTNELMSVTGHKDPKTVQIYLRNAEEMRVNAFTKLASKSSPNHNTN